MPIVVVEECLSIPGRQVIGEAWSMGICEEVMADGDCVCVWGGWKGRNA